MTQLLKKLWSGEEAQNLPEYALLLFLVCLTAVTTMGAVAAEVHHIYSNASAHVMPAGGNPAMSSESSSYHAEAPRNTQSKLKDNKEQKPAD